MAGGIDWFRWHHGSVTDPKFQLVAKRAGVRTSDVIAVWAFMLEKASASETRGQFGDIDCEAVDCLFGMEDGSTEAIRAALDVRKLTDSGAVVAWEKRQPKREREDDTAAQRKRDQRERDAANGNQTPPAKADASHVTQCHATSHQKTPREEESREEQDKPPTPSGVVPPTASPRATRKCPAAFVVTPELLAWAASEAPNVPLDTETAKLRDHTFKNAISDWPGAWRNWIRGARERQDSRPSPAAKALSFAERDAANKRAQVSAWTGGRLGRDPVNTIDMEATDATLTRLG